MDKKEKKGKPELKSYEQRPDETVNLNDTFNFADIKKGGKTSGKGYKVDALLSEKINSKSGLSVLEAKRILYGSEEEAKLQDPSGKQTRDTIRDTWKGTCTPDKISVAITGTAQVENGVLVKHGQRYFNILKTEEEKFKGALKQAHLNIKYPD